MSPPLFLKPYISYWHLALPMMLVLTGSFAMKDEDASVAATASENAYDIPEDMETKLRQLLDLSSTGATPQHEEKRTSTSSSKRLLVDALKSSQGKHARRLTEDSLTCENPEWTQIGSNIDGENSNDLFGHTVALSADGTILAVGVPGNDNGYVRVYRKSTSLSLGWEQIGGDLDGEALDDEFGYSVSLSDDGTVLAVGGWYNDANGDKSGHARVYESDTSTSLGWSQIGQDIDGEASFDYFGVSIALSGSGDILAVGASSNDGNGTGSGHIRVYERNLLSTLGWDQIHDDIDGEASFDGSGCAVALSQSGDIVAIGASSNDGNGSGSGHVRVYKRGELAWIQEGSDIDGESDDDFSGFSVDLSDDGTILAIGAPYAGSGYYYRGHVRVYTRNPSSSKGWSKVGSDFDVTVNSGLYGRSVALSGDGNILAIGTDSNYARVYRRAPTTLSGWVQVGDDLSEGFFVLTGYSVALSKNGEVLAIGNPKRDINGDDSGNVQVFEACDQPMPTMSPAPTLSSAPTNSPTYSFPLSPPCGTEQDRFKIQMVTDNSGEDISWKIQIKKSGEFEDYFGRGADYGDAYDDNKGLRENYCFPKGDECYRFVILDSAGDGLCCSNGDGGYRITFKGDIVKESRFKDKEFEFIKFGRDNDC